MLDMARAAKASCRVAALYCIFVLLMHDLRRVSAPITNSQQTLGHRKLLDRAMLSTADGSTSSSSSRSRTLLGQSMDLSRGPGLFGVPDSAFGISPPTGSSSSLSFMAAAQEPIAPQSLAECPAAGKFLTTEFGATGLQTPITWAWDGSAVAWGSPAAPPKPEGSGGGSVGTVYFLDSEQTCNFSQSNTAKLPNPVVLLPVNYALEPDKETGAPSLAHISASEAASVVLVGTKLPAIYNPPKQATNIQTEAGTAVPYILAAFSYRRYLRPNTTKPIFIPAGVLPIPAVAAPNVALTGLSVSLDGRTALACVAPVCSGPNPSACGSGWAHIFRMSPTGAAAGSDIGGHAWNLVAQLPFAGYGTPYGHGVSCSLSLDGGTAAVLAAGAVVETVNVPVTSNNTTTTSSGGGGSRRLHQPNSGGSEVQFTTVTTTTRNAYMQMYAATSSNGPWAAVGTQPLDPVIAECIMGGVSCKPVVDVSDRFAAVAYINGPQLKADVIFHNAPQAAANNKRAEFVKVCTLEKLLVKLDDDKKSDITIPQPSASQLAGVTIRQPSGTLSLRVMVATRNPGAFWIWNLSRRGEQACPASPKNLLEGINPSYAPLPLLTADVTGDGLVSAFSGVTDGDGDNRLGAIGSY